MKDSYYSSSEMKQMKAPAKKLLAEVHTGNLRV